MIRVECFSEAGDSHPNEDAFVVESHPLDPTLFVCLIADGQGGRAGGARAAKLACETGVALATRTAPDRLHDRATWEGVIHEIDRAVEADKESGFTTAVGFCVSFDRVVGASSGDSGALLVTDHKVTVLTQWQNKNPPVGSGETAPVSFDTMIRSPWQLLALTDGVWKYVGWDRVIETTRRERGKDLLKELERAARLPRSGRFQDDFTAVLLESVSG
jgi:serine/threonine protein phosphatase PrpC